MSNFFPNSKTAQARIVSGSLVLLSGSGLTTAISLAYNIIVARFLGPNDFGQATAVYTLLTLLSAVTLSYQLVAAKLTAQQCQGQGQNADARAVHHSALGCGLLVGILLFASRHQIAAFLNLPNPLLVVLLAAGAAFYVPLGARRGQVQGAHGFRRLASNLVIEGVVRLLGSLLMVYLGFGVEGVVGANAAALVVAYLLLGRGQAEVSCSGRFGPVHREVAHAAVFFSGQMLINNCDIVLVKHFFPPVAAGLYAVLAMVGRVLFAASQAVVNSMVPVVAGTRAEERRVVPLISTALLLVLALGSAVALGLRLSPAWLWSDLFGAGFYLPGHHGFPYLLALYAVTSAVYSLSAVLITYEMSYKIANTSWIQLVFSGLIICGIWLFHSSLQQVIIVQLVLVSLLLVMVSCFFLKHVILEKKARDQSTGDPIRLLCRVSEDEVIAEFLKSEFGKTCYAPYHESMRGLVHSPDMTSKEECAKRRALLLMKHGALWRELPADTQWYEVQLQPSHLPVVRAFPRAQWRKIARGNYEITNVAERLRNKVVEGDPFLEKLASIRKCLNQGEAQMGCAVLIGIDPEEQLTLLDGNHRFVSAVLEGKMERLRILCGFSPKMLRCCWYKTNFFTLVRYGSNLLRHLTSDPEAEVIRLCDMSQDSR